MVRGYYEIEPRIRILLGLASANWDEAVFENADSFNISRSVKRHFTFGSGGHFCPGSQLSRQEGRLFLEDFIERFPEFRLVGEPHVFNELTFVAIEKLSVGLSGRN